MEYSRSSMKSLAKAQLGGSIFGSDWVYAAIISLLFGAITGLAGTAIPVAGAFLLVGPMSYGFNRYFLAQSRKQIDSSNLSTVLSGFRDGNFGQLFLLGLMRCLYVLLWSLLFLVPGLVKSYSYSMAFYVKADHPDYDWSRCLQESKKLMTGRKWDLFVLDLSFIGWQLVGAFCFGIGTLWVTAYQQAARAQFYEYISDGDRDEEYLLDAGVRI